MTLRCLIADDEDLILERLEHFFDKHREEFQLVGKAYSGQEGIEIALREKPDIVVTDIVMPELNGIEMVERLRKELPSTEFIVLTAYSDFEYAKQAIRNGVQDYIIKVPLSEEALLQALRRARETLISSRRKEEEFLKINQYRLHNLYRMRRQMLTELLQGNLSADRFAALAEGVNIAPDLGVCCCLAVEWADATKFRGDYSAQDQGTIRYGSINIMEETIGGAGTGFASEISDHRILGVVSLPRESAGQQLSRLQTLGNRIIHNIRLYMKQDVHVAVSRPFTAWSGLSHAYNQVSRLLDYAYYHMTGEVWLEQQAYAGCFTNNQSLIAPHMQELMSVCRTEYSANQVGMVLDSIRRELMKIGLEPRLLAAALTDFMRQLQEHRKLFREDGPALPNLASLEPRFHVHWEAVTAFIQAGMTAISGRTEIVRVRHYIEAHIAHRLSLEELAGIANMNASYFSSVFKKEMNEPVTDYVNRRKMERAAAYLREGNYSNGEICALIGLNSEKYFCTLFKQFFGVTPQKYRRECLGR